MANKHLNIISYQENANNNDEIPLYTYNMVKITEQCVGEGAEEQELLL